MHHGICLRRKFHLAVNFAEQELSCQMSGSKIVLRNITKTNIQIFTYICLSYYILYNITTLLIGQQPTLNPPIMNKI